MFSEEYQAAFSARIKKHFFVDPVDPASGALAVVGGLDRAVGLYQSEMSKFEPLLFCESARWGYLDKAVPYTKSDPAYLPGETTKGDWDRTTGHILNTWLPQRRNKFLSDMENAAFPLYTP